MKELEVTAPAKINLSLEINGLREDGFHELKMILQSIKLHDLICLRKKEDGITLQSSLKELPDDRTNLAYRAAESLFSTVDLKQGVDIHIEKNIPLAAGLAGGSTDAAAVLFGLNKLYNLKLSANTLLKIGGKIGSDVPFCLQKGTALGKGRGNKLTVLPDIKDLDLILVNPPVQVKTARIYQEFDRLRGKISIPEIPTEKLIEIIKNGKNINWDEGWGNQLEPVTSHLIKDIKIIKKLLAGFGVKFNLMTGSGPTVFGILNNKQQGYYIKNNWPRPEDKVIVTRTL